MLKAVLQEEVNSTHISKNMTTIAQRPGRKKWKCTIVKCLYYM